MQKTMLLRNILFVLILFAAIDISLNLTIGENSPNEEVGSFQSQSAQSIDAELSTNNIQAKCEPLSAEFLPICKDIAYNETRLPNFMKQRSQKEAAADLALYLPLIKINCSPVLKLFLCSLYAPPCVRNYSSTLKPCREMCEKVKSGCEDVLKRFSYNWPEYIECSNFPSFNGPEACVTDEAYSNNQDFLQSNSIQSFTNLNSNGFGQNSLGQNSLVPNSLSPSLLNPGPQHPFTGVFGSGFLSNLNPQQQQIFFSSLASNTINTGVTSRNYYQMYGNNFYALAAAAAAAAAANYRVKFTCPPVLQIISDTKNTYYLTFNEEVVNNCAIPCDNNLFEKSEISFARSWVLVWSTVCFGSTLFTILTFLIEMSRFRYPERPIIFLSACYMIVALGYLIGSSSLTNNFVVCKSMKNGMNQVGDYLVQGVEHFPCTLLFMMIYFFGMASSIWWVVLTLTWFLAAGLKWGHEAIENISSYFHLAAWAIPGVKMIAILWLQKVDADVLSGVCYTGIRNINLMRGFILAPLFSYLILGSCFLLAGFVSLFRIRTVMKHEGNKTDKLEKFMVRIGVFSILYIVPTIIVICCYFYEQSSYNKWIDFWLRKNYMEFNLLPDFVNNSLYEIDRSALIFSLFMVKYAMLFIIGITSGFWIWSHKTVTSWQIFFDRIMHCFNGLNPKYKNEAAV